MIVKIDKSFEKDVKKINASVKSSLASLILEIQKADKITDISNVKKLQGTRNFFRIRIGDYRLGIIVSGQKVELIRFLHRKEIYRYFP